MASKRQRGASGSWEYIVKRKGLLPDVHVVGMDNPAGHETGVDEPLLE